jgi:hypothetical protein
MTTAVAATTTATITVTVPSTVADLTSAEVTLSALQQ